MRMNGNKCFLLNLIFFITGTPQNIDWPVFDLGISPGKILAHNAKTQKLDTADKKMTHIMDGQPATGSCQKMFLITKNSIITNAAPQKKIPP